MHDPHAPAPVSATGRPLPRAWLAVVAVIWLGQAVSMVTSYAASFAAVWYVTETTGSAIMLSAMSICAYLPQGLLSPVGGMVADRVNRKVVLVVADFAVGLVSLGLGVAIMLGHISVAAIFALVVLRSSGQAFHGPAMMATMPMLVPQEHLLRINTLDQMLMSLAGVGSPALGIMLYTNLGFHAVMFLDFAGACIACAALLPAKVPSLERLAPGSEQAAVDGAPARSGLAAIVAEMGAGWRAIAGNRGLLLFFVILTLIQVSFGPIGSLYPLMTYDHFAGDGYMASIVEATFAAGMLFGSVVVMAWGGGRRLALLVSVASVLSGLLCAAAGLTPPTLFWVFAVLCGLLGFMCAGFNGPMVTLVQRNVAEDCMGRAMGFVTMMMGLATPLGIAVGGVVAQGIGVAPFFLVDGLLFAVLGACLYLPRSVRALDAPPASPAPADA